MSRHGYIDDIDDNWQFILYRGHVASAMNGKRGQGFLKEMAAAMDAMDRKELVQCYLVDEDGCVCAIGSALVARGVPIEEIQKIDPENTDQIAELAGIAPSMAREIMYENDDYHEFPNKQGYDYREERWQYMRRWIDRHIKKEVIE